MAVKEFNCNKLKRTFWPFTLKDKVGETGEVLENGKKITDLEELDEENTKIEDTDSIYRLLAAVLNNNMGKVPVKAEDVEDYDIEECTAILKAYMEFVDELKADPN